MSAGVHALAGGGCVIQRCQNKNPREELGPGNVSDVTHWKRGLRFWGSEKKQFVEFLPGRKKVDFRGPPRPDGFVRYGRCALVGLRADDVKAVSIERLCVSLSPHVEKLLNSKRLIKVSYLNQFRECRVFWIPYVYFTHPYIMGMLHNNTCLLIICFFSSQLIVAERL